jgi:hypothetical protein
MFGIDRRSPGGRFASRVAECAVVAPRDDATIDRIVARPSV